MPWPNNSMPSVADAGGAMMGGMGVSGLFLHHRHASLTQYVPQWCLPKRHRIGYTSVPRIQG